MLCVFLMKFAKHFKNRCLKMDVQNVGDLRYSGSIPFNSTLEGLTGQG